MKLYSPVNKPTGPGEDVSDKPAPYNWLLLLVIFIGYIVFAILL